MNPTLNTQITAVGPAEYKECFKCSFRGETADMACPKCGKRLRTSKNIRTRGVIQIVTGVILVLMMAGLSILIGILITKGANDPGTAKQLTEQRTFILATYAFFGVLALFGLNGIVMGTWQVVTGRRNKVLMWIMIMLLVMIIIASLTMVFLVK